MRFITLGDYLKWASEEFSKAGLHFGHGTDNAWDEAVHVAIHVLDLPIENHSSILNRELNRQEGKEFKSIVYKRLSTKKPLPYIIGYCWYAYEKYIVNKDSLIPRSPIFEFILNGFKPYLKYEPTNILDLCTGGGCLAIVAAKQFREANVLAADISRKALDVARRNVELHKVNNVSLLESNLFSMIETNNFDVIISNPPYVSRHEMQTLPVEYTYEPVIALESPDNGLAIPKQIMLQAVDYLSDYGILIIEVGNTYYELEKLDRELKKYAVRPTVGGHGIYILSKEDLKGVNERINKRIDTRA